MNDVKEKEFKKSNVIIPQKLKIIYNFKHKIHIILLCTKGKTIRCTITSLVNVFIESKKFSK